MRIKDRNKFVVTEKGRATVYISKTSSIERINKLKESGFTVEFLEDKYKESDTNEKKG